MRLRHVLPLLAAGIAGLALAAEATKRVWDFEADAPGKIAKGFTSEVGQWEVATDGENHVLYQKARNEDAIFNVALVAGTSYKDLDLSVKLKAVAGEIDRGGGAVWRAKDKDNYYICRYNPLEDNFRVYKVVDGKRSMFKGAKTPGDEKWHTLRVTMAGTKITCYLDGKKSLEVEDTTFSEAGKIGLWSKADAQSYFDDLTMTE
jgi:3-keto-disaccharide hydrolase